MNRASASAAHIDRLLCACLVVLALAVILLSADVSYVGGVNAPYADMWGFTNPAHYLSTPFTLFNGHPLLLNRLTLALDYWAFDGGGDAIRIGILLAKFGEGVAFYAMGRMAGVTARRDQIILGATAVLLALSPAPYVNLRQQFQFGFVTAFAASAGAIACLSAYAVKQGAGPLIWSAVLCVIATQSLLNGVLAPFLLIVMALLLRLPRHVLLLFLVILALAIASITLPGGDAAAVPSAVQTSIVSDTLQIVGVAPALLCFFASNPQTLAPDIGVSSLVFGVLIAAASAAAIWRALMRSPAKAAEVGGAALIVFGLASAGMVALGRMVEPEGPGARFAEASLITLGGLTVVAAGYAQEFSTAVWRACSAAIAAAAIVTLLSAPSLIAFNEGVQRGRLMAQTAQIVGVPDSRASSALTARRPTPRPVLEFLKARGKMHFADRWARAVGQPLEARTERTCHANIVVRRAQFAGYVNVRGAIAGKQLRDGRSIIIVAADGSIVGYARTPRRWYDFLRPFIKVPTEQIVGYAIQRQDGNYRAYLANQHGLVCQINVRTLR
jgi:hypothetical protein